MDKTCYQINLSELLGGGEIYTHFFSRALLANGWNTVIFVNRKAQFWDALDLSGVTLIPVENQDAIPTLLPSSPSLIVTHTPVSGTAARELRRAHLLAGFAHHPMYGGNAEPYREYQLIFPVSQYVIGTLDKAGIKQYYPQPLYGVADLDRLKRPDAAPLTATPMYDWDRRKLRDCILKMLYPAYWRFVSHKTYAKKSGLTLGIVSRIAPAKQFAQQFQILAPIIRKFPNINVEFFGSSVGYSPVRKLRQSLKPIRRQVRFWGPQENVRQIYHSIDFLMSGLPEREAMGLNIIEAQLCGTPVLAVNAQPFTEIVAQGKTGFFYTDPRQDGGKDFEKLLHRLTSQDQYPNPADHPEHLALFSFAAFADRVRVALDHAQSVLETLADTGNKTSTKNLL